MEVETDGFRISSNFDSGNLHRIEKVEPGSVAFDDQDPDNLCAHEFNCWVKPDCGGTEYENNNRTWFHFSLSGGPPFATVRFNMMNMNRQGKLYAQGMRTVYKVEPIFPEWKRLSDTHLYKVGDEGNFIMSFKYYTLEDARCTTYFAFSFPYSYTELQAALNTRDLAFRISPPACIYYHRELLTYSLDGRRVDLLTITAGDGGEGREARLPGLFPLAGTEFRAVRFPTRRVVLLSARVHPGETPSSHVLDGCIQFLLTPHKCAERLRRLFVFKVIPMLNPDGVARGHYRTNIHGSNLNRMYSDPVRALYPEVYAAKSVALYHHLGRIPADCELLDSEPSVAEVDAQFVRPRDMSWSVSGGASSSPAAGVASSLASPVASTPAPPVPPRPELEDVSNDASCIAGDTDEYSLGMPDLSPLKSLLQLTPRRTAAETTLNVLRQVDSLQVTSVGSDSESLVSSADAEPASTTSSSSLASSRHPELIPAPSTAKSNLFLYVDMHGHASKRGCFMYGNHFSEEEEMVDCMLLPKLVSLNSPNFDFLACNFTEKNMHHKGKRDGLSKEGSGRVAVYRATGLIRSYTLECNYNTGRFCNVLPPQPGEPELPANVPLVYEPVPYTPPEYRQVGEAMLISILDLCGENPQPRLPRSEYIDVDGVRAWIRRFMHVTRFGENNITFSPEKTARTMKSHTTERLRQVRTREASGLQASMNRDEVSSPGGRQGASPAAAARRAALASSPGSNDGKDLRRPARRLRKGKAKKLAPGKVEDQENAVVAPARHKRSADALLASASAKVDAQAASADTTSLAGPSRLRVKSPVLQPRLGQQAAPGHAPPGLTRAPAVRRALSEKRRVLKPSPVRLGDGASLGGATGRGGGGGARLRRSASLVSAPPASEEGATEGRAAVGGAPAWSEQLQISSGATGGGKGTSKRAPKRKKRPPPAEVSVVRVQETLPPCRSLGHLIQLVSTPPVTFASLFPTSASTSHLESCSTGAAGAGAGASSGGGAPWTGRSEPALLQDEAATLPETADASPAEASPLSFAGALSSASNSPRAGSPRSPASKGSGASPPAADPPADLLSVNVTSSAAGHSGRGFRPPSRQDTGLTPPSPPATHISPLSPASASHQPTSPSHQPTSPPAASAASSGVRRAGRQGRGAGGKARCTTRRAAKKSAKTLRVKRAAALPTLATSVEAEAAAKPARNKLTRRASAPLYRVQQVLTALDMLPVPGGLRPTDSTPSRDDVTKVKPGKSRLKKSRSTATPELASCSRSASYGGGTWEVASAPLDASARRSASEGAPSPPAAPSAAPAASSSATPARPKGRLVKRGVLERARAALQPARKRKRAKDKA